LEIETLLANPEAHLANKRFIDTDLNREFKCDTLCVVDDKEEGGFDDDEGILDSGIESRRAKELDGILGSKCEGSVDEFDVAIDLHTTTSNMGITLIVNEGDELMTQGAAFVAARCQDAKILMHSIPEREERPTLSSAAKHGFTIEVGPVPQGILRHDAVINTESAMHALLEFFQRKNQGLDLTAEFKEGYPNGLVPCFRTAPARRTGEISGKITWPSDAENPNFPSLMIHKSLQDKDFTLLQIGDPLFIGPDRSVIYYDGSHGDSVYVVFVNEGGYYYASSGTGIGVAVSADYDLTTGLLVEEPKFEEFIV
jgi:succinylglutamate desuccinylase